MSSMSSPKHPDRLRPELRPYHDKIIAREYSGCLQDLNSSYHELAHFSEFWLLLGICLNESLAPSIQIRHAYLAGLSIEPNHPDLLYNLANHLRNESPQEAQQLYTKSIESDPFNAHSWHNLSLLLDPGLTRDVISCLKTSHLIDPLSPSILCNLGLQYQRDNLLPIAKRCFFLSLHLDPFYLPSKVNLGCLYLDLGFPQLAIELLSSHELSDIPQALYNLSLCYLTLANYDQGLDLYEYRPLWFSSSIQEVVDNLPRLTTLADLSSTKDKPVLIVFEQGIGDSIMYFRYLYLLDALDIQYHFVCQDSLVPLLSAQDVKGTISHSVYPPQSYSYYAPLLSLPKLFKTDPYIPPSSLPYITPPTDTSRIQLPTADGVLRIAINWSSDPNNQKLYTRKSFPIVLLIPTLQILLQKRLIHLYNIQHNSDSRDLDPIAHLPGLHFLTPEISNFADTSSILSEADLVISVDTAVAHLSGALRRPTWLLLPYNADPRWLLGTSSSPWYPSTMRLFRQTSPGDWTSVSDQLVKALEELFLLDLDSLE